MSQVLTLSHVCAGRESDSMVEVKPRCFIFNCSLYYFETVIDLQKVAEQCPAPSLVAQFPQ